MRIPMKINRASRLAGLVPRRLTAPDPRALIQGETLSPDDFTAHVSVMRADNTYKSTRRGRHALGDALLLDHLGDLRPAIVDIGVSDGSTSLDLLERLGDAFTRYHVTDRVVSLVARRDPRGRIWVLDADGSCVLRAGPHFVLHPSVLRLLPSPSGVWEEIPLPLIQPALRTRATVDPRVLIQAYDIFQPWQGLQADVVKVANLWNRVYFPDARIRLAAGHVLRMLRPGGLLLLIDNRTEERVSLFRKDGGAFRLLDTINGGSEVSDLLVGFDG